MEIQDQNALKNMIIDLADELRGETGEQEGPILGYTDGPPRGQDLDFVFLNREEFDTGHILVEDEDGNVYPEEVPGGAMTGYLTDVRYRKKETEEYGLIQKLRIRLDCGDFDIMAETGFFTLTSKSLLSSLASMENTGEPVTLVPDPADPNDEGATRNSKNILFMDAFEGDELLMTDSDAWPDSDQDVIDLFQMVRLDILGLEEQEDQPQVRNSGGGGGSRSRNNGGGGSDNSSGGARRSRRGSRSSSGDSGGAPERRQRSRSGRPPKGSY